MLAQLLQLSNSPTSLFLKLYISLTRYKDDANEALRELDGVDVCGRRVRVTMALPRTRGRNRGGFDPSMRCYQCGRTGHFR